MSKRTRNNRAQKVRIRRQEAFEKAKALTPRGKKGRQPGRGQMTDWGRRLASSEAWRDLLEKKIRILRGLRASVSTGDPAVCVDAVRSLRRKVRGREGADLATFAYAAITHEINRLSNLIARMEVNLWKFATKRNIPDDTFNTNR